MTQAAIIRRSSFLKRNPNHTREAFSRYYEASHGPLAASLPGFRKHTVRYVQNHVENHAGHSLPFDGITITTQVPRKDYSVGFFNEPDYERIKDDEVYLFDVSRAVSVLGDVIEGPLAPQDGFKAVFLAGAGWVAPRDFRVEGATTHALSRCDLSTATALGFRNSAFGHPHMIEAWFRTRDARDGAVARSDRLAGAGSIAMPVREVLIFGPEKPWPSDASA